MAEFITLLIDASVPLLLTVVILWLLFTALGSCLSLRYVIERFGKYTRTLHAGRLFWYLFYRLPINIDTGTPVPNQHFSDYP